MSILRNAQTQITTNPLVQPLLDANVDANGLSNLILGQPSIPNFRAGAGITNRGNEIMSFRLPSGFIVDMYINPQSLEITDKKVIVPVRTKGGYAIQYWGEDLTEITISGHTGSSGIEGINVLRNIYRSENTSFDLVAASQQAELNSILNQITDLQSAEISKTVSDYNTALQKRNYLLRPSLGSLATSVIMFYQGVQYKGYFTSMTVTEDTNEIGLIKYKMTFMATNRAGQRRNYLAWHKSPVANDTAGQLLNSAGNAIRGALGLGAQAAIQFTPQNAPYTFGSYQDLVTLGLSSPQQATQTTGL